MEYKLVEGLQVLRMAQNLEPSFMQQLKVLVNLLCQELETVLNRLDLLNHDLHCFQWVGHSVQLLNDERFLHKNGVHKLQNGLLKLVPGQPLPPEHPCIVNIQLPLFSFIGCLLRVNLLQTNAKHFNQQLNQ